MVELSRRQFLKIGASGLLGLYVGSRFGGFGATPVAEASIPGGTLDPVNDVMKYQTPMLIPPVMPRAGTIKNKMGKNSDYYEISMKQFRQKILPAAFYAGLSDADLKKGTLVWGYGAVTAASKKGLLLHNAPSLTIEADYNRPVRVKWINGLMDGDGNYLPHLLAVDPTLHWANPPGPIDTRPTTFPGPYTGPVPIVTHVHGAIGVGDESDGYTEAWFLPAANDTRRLRH